MSALENKRVTRLTFVIELELVFLKFQQILLEFGAKGIQSLNLVCNFCNLAIDKRLGRQLVSLRAQYENEVTYPSDMQILLVALDLASLTLELLSTKDFPCT